MAEYAPAPRIREAKATAIAMPAPWEQGKLLESSPVGLKFERLPSQASPVLGKALLGAVFLGALGFMFRQMLPQAKK